MNDLATINSGMSKDLKLLAAKTMPDGALAIAIEYKGEIIATRIYLTQLLGFMHQHHLKEQKGPPYINTSSKLNFKFDIASKDYYVINKKDFYPHNFYEVIPEYNHLKLDKKLTKLEHEDEL